MEEESNRNLSEHRTKSHALKRVLASFLLIPALFVVMLVLSTIKNKIWPWTTRTGQQVIDNRLSPLNGMSQAEVDRLRFYLISSKDWRVSVDAYDDLVAHLCKEDSDLDVEFWLSGDSEIDSRRYYSTTIATAYTPFITLPIYRVYPAAEEASFYSSRLVIGDTHSLSFEVDQDSSFLSRTATQQGIAKAYDNIWRVLRARSTADVIKMLPPGSIAHCMHDSITIQEEENYKDADVHGYANCGEPGYVYVRFIPSKSSDAVPEWMEDDLKGDTNEYIGYSSNKNLRFYYETDDFNIQFVNSNAAEKGTFELYFHSTSRNSPDRPVTGVKFTIQPNNDMI